MRVCAVKARMQRRTGPVRARAVVLLFCKHTIERPSGVSSARRRAERRSQVLLRYTGSGDKRCGGSISINRAVLSREQDVDIARRFDSASDGDDVALNQAVHACNPDGGSRPPVVVGIRQTGSDTSTKMFWSSE
jgi:hypothetical protein